MSYTESEKAELLDEVLEPNKKELERFRLIQGKLGQKIHNEPEAVEVERPPQTEEEEIEEVKNNLLALSKHNAMAGKVFLQLKGLLVEKQEHKVEFDFSAEDHIRIAREADRRIREANLGTDRSQGLPEKPPILLDEVCMDNRQEHSPDNQVETVELPT